MTSWERRSQWPLVAIAVAFLFAYAWPILDTDLTDGWRHTCELVQLCAWAAFAIDYGVRLFQSPQRWRFVRRNLLDLLVLALPMLRPLRLLRLVLLLRVFNRTAEATLRGRVAVYVGGGVIVIGLIAALGVLDAERDSPTANITTFGDALWWTCTTITTVGYGDLYPVTPTGRVVAVGLMVAGIALLGTVTATLASWFSERVRADEQVTDDLVREVRQLQEQLEAVVAAIPALTGGPPSRDSSQTRVTED